METGTSKTSLKVTAARFGAWGLGFGLGVGIVLAASLWFIERPKGWNNRDLVPHNIKAEGIGHAKIEGSNLDVDGIGTSFSFDLQNTTSEDITLPKDVRVMQSEKSSGSLEDSSLVFAKDYFLPAKHTVAVSIQNPNECIKTMKTDECFDAIFKNVGEILIFDQSAKREIRLAVPDFSGRKDGAPSFFSTD
jgi:hypothetical protein